MQHEFDGTKYVIRLDNGSVLSLPGFHCLEPFAGPNGFIFFSKVGNARSVIARASTGTLYELPEAGSWQTLATDGRYVIGACRKHQGKQFYRRDLVGYIFDTQVPGWLNFATLGRPTMDIFRAVGAGQKPNLLWIQNGRQVDGFYGSDPVGVVRRVSFLTPTLIDYVLEQKGAHLTTSGFLRLQRSIVLATGEMSPIAQVASIMFDPLKPPALPSWIESTV